MTKHEEEPQTSSAAVYTAGQREHLVRWATDGRLPDLLFSRTRRAVLAARGGTLDQLRGELSILSRRRNALIADDAYHLLAALDGHLVSLAFALVHSEPLLTLAKTIAQRATGLDTAEISSGRCGHIVAAAIDTGQRYDVSVFAPAKPWRGLNTAAMAAGRLWEYDAGVDRPILARYSVDVASAAAAMEHAVRREYDAPLLDDPQRAEFGLQVTRLTRLDDCRPRASGEPRSRAENDRLALSAVVGDPLVDEPEWIPLLVRTRAGDAIARSTVAERAPNLLAEYDAAPLGAARERARANLTDWSDASHLAFTYRDGYCAAWHSTRAEQLEQAAATRRAPDHPDTATGAAWAGAPAADLPPQTTPTPSWHATVRAVAGDTALADPSGPSPAELPQLAAQTPLGEHPGAEPAGRVLDACPAAHSPTPTAGGITGDARTTPPRAADNPLPGRPPPIAPAAGQARRGPRR